MTDTLRLVGNNRELDLYPWLNEKTQGHEALAGILGFGLPGVDNQWFEGVGYGSSYRGGRVKRRVISLPLKVYAEDRAQLNRALSDLAVVLDPNAMTPGGDNTARMFFGMPDDVEWYIDVVRSSGGDWARKVDSDDRTYFKTTIGLESGDAFWTRNEPEEFKIERDPSAPSLLPRLAKLRVSSATAFGTREVENVGDTFAWATFHISGPGTGFTLIGPRDEIVSWQGQIAVGARITVNMRENTVEDSSGENLYDGLATAPEFWPIAPGISEVSVAVAGSTAETQVVAQWRPRRWAVV